MPKRVGHPLISQATHWASHIGMGDMRRHPRQRRKHHMAVRPSHKLNQISALLTEGEVLTASWQCFCLIHLVCTQVHRRWQSWYDPQSLRARYLILIWRWLGVMDKNSLIMGSLSHEKRFVEANECRRSLCMAIWWCFSLQAEQDPAIVWKLKEEKKNSLQSEKEKVLCWAFSCSKVQWNRDDVEWWLTKMGCNDTWGGMEDPDEFQQFWLITNLHQDSMNLFWRYISVRERWPVLSYSISRWLGSLRVACASGKYNFIKWPIQD